jgi:hypothetical protein
VRRRSSEAVEGSSARAADPCRLCARAVAVAAIIPDVQEHVSETKSYVGPLFVGDAGVTFGHSPGAKLYLGVMMMLELTGRRVARGAEQALGYSVDPATGLAARQRLAIPPLVMTKAPQFFLGPMLGVRFGS